MANIIDIHARQDVRSLQGGAGDLSGVAASGGFALFGIERDAINSAEGRFTMMEWVSPDFEEVETSAEVTAYVGHW